MHGQCEGALDAFSPEWWRMLIFASQEAERLGLSFETHVSNGYVAGGPWITPALGMQRLTSVRTVVEGGKSMELALPVPETRYDYYKDVAILAFPYQNDKQDDSQLLEPVITCNKPEINAVAVFSQTDSKRLPVIPEQKAGEPVYLTLDFGKVFTARSITYLMNPKGRRPLVRQMYLVRLPIPLLELVIVFCRISVNWRFRTMGCILRKYAN